MDTIPERFPEEFGIEVGDGATDTSLITKRRWAFAIVRENKVEKQEAR
jgi:hypothetical protein